MLRVAQDDRKDGAWSIFGSYGSFISGRNLPARIVLAQDDRAFGIMSERGVLGFVAFHPFDDAQGGLWPQKNDCAARMGRTAHG
jgi:hypothetical protein